MSWQIVAYVLSLVGSILAIYIGMSKQLAILEERDAQRREQVAQMRAELAQGIQSLQANIHGLETYILELHRNERNER